MQLLLPSRVNFQVTPRDVNLDSLIRKMYQPKRTVMYGRSPYSRGVSGLAFTPELCDPMDVACVQRNVAASVAGQQQTGEVQALSDYDQCIANGTDAGTCGARWPSGYSGEVPFTNLTPDQQAAQMQTPVQAEASYLSVPNVSQELHTFGISPTSLLTPTPVLTWSSAPELPSGGSSGGGPGGGSPPPAKPNQSVPPTTPLTPMNTGFQNTAQAIANQAAAGQAGQQQAPPSTQQCQFWQAPSKTTPGQCDTNTALLVGGLAVVGLFVFMGGKR